MGGEQEFMYVNFIISFYSPLLSFRDIISHVAPCFMKKSLRKELIKCHLSLHRSPLPTGMPSTPDFPAKVKVSLTFFKGALKGAVTLRVLLSTDHLETVLLRNSLY